MDLLMEDARGPRRGLLVALAFAPILLAAVLWLPAWWEKREYREMESIAGVEARVVPGRLADAREKVNPGLDRRARGGHRQAFSLGPYRGEGLGPGDLDLLLRGRHHADQHHRWPGPAGLRDVRAAAHSDLGAAAVSSGRPGPSETREPSIRVIMMPKDTNAHGTIFGGVILSYIDQAGAVEAKRHGANFLVTVAMREVVFHEPVNVGDLVSFYTRLVKIGRTSITVSVEVVSQPGEGLGQSCQGDRSGSHVREPGRESQAGADLEVDAKYEGPEIFGAFFGSSRAKARQWERAERILLRTTTPGPHRSRW